VPQLGGGEHDLGLALAGGAAPVATQSAGILGNADGLFAQGQIQPEQSFELIVDQGIDRVEIQSAGLSVVENGL
jgi:hypothetical protein